MAHVRHAHSPKITRACGSATAPTKIVSVVNLRGNISRDMFLNTCTDGRIAAGGLRGCTQFYFLKTYFGSKIGCDRAIRRTTIMVQHWLRRKETSSGKHFRHIAACAWRQRCWARHQKYVCSSLRSPVSFRFLMSCCKVTGSFYRAKTPSFEG